MLHGNERSRNKRDMVNQLRHEQVVCRQLEDGIQGAWMSIPVVEHWCSTILCCTVQDHRGFGIVCLLATVQAPELQSMRCDFLIGKALPLLLTLSSYAVSVVGS